MTSSLVYAGIMGSILASLRSLKTWFIAFDTQVADLTDMLHDPVELLFSTQLGGGTDIQKALGYAEKRITRPQDTFVVVISDLYEGANVRDTLQRYRQLLHAGVQVVNILALNDEGAPDYDKKLAQQLTNMGVPSFACTPAQFPSMMGALLSGKDLQGWMAEEGIVPKG